MKGKGRAIIFRRAKEKWGREGSKRNGREPWGREEFRQSQFVKEKGVWKISFVKKDKFVVESFIGDVLVFFFAFFFLVHASFGSWICNPILALGFWYILFNENYPLIENHDLSISKYIWHGFNVLFSNMQYCLTFPWNHVV